MDNKSTYICGRFAQSSSGFILQPFDFELLLLMPLHTSTVAVQTLKGGNS